MGNPYDGDPRGSYALVTIDDSLPPAAEIIRFTYPVDKVMAAVIDRQVPGIEPDVYRFGTRDLKHLEQRLEQTTAAGITGGNK